MKLNLNSFESFRPGPRSQQLIPHLNNFIYHFAFYYFINIKILLCYMILVFVPYDLDVCHFIMKMGTVATYFDLHYKIPENVTFRTLQMKSKF